MNHSYALQQNCPGGISLAAIALFPLGQLLSVDSVPPFSALVQVLVGSPVAATPLLNIPNLPVKTATKTTRTIKAIAAIIITLIDIP